jgi:two-component system, chemotaxis family, chemotaxis protein CheY
MVAALVIDDNFHNRHIFRIALEHAGFGVTESEDGLKGLNALKNGEYELVILDLRMPGMDGTDVLRIMRKTEELQATQVVVVTANPHMVTDDIRTMADYVLQKPVDIPTFAALARRLFAKSPKQ